jgi:hypothetical protein
MSRDLPQAPEWSLQEISETLHRIAESLDKADSAVVEEEYSHLIRVGGVAVGMVVAREITSEGRIIYEVEPIGPWRDMPPHPRQMLGAS